MMTGLCILYLYYIIIIIYIILYVMDFPTDFIDYKWN